MSYTIETADIVTTAHVLCLMQQAELRLHPSFNDRVGISPTEVAISPITGVDIPTFLVAPTDQMKDITVGVQAAGTLIPKIEIHNPNDERLPVIELLPIPSLVYAVEGQGYERADDTGIQPFRFAESHQTEEKVPMADVSADAVSGTSYYGPVTELVVFSGITPTKPMGLGEYFGVLVLVSPMDTSVPSL